MLMKILEKIFARIPMAERMPFYKNDQFQQIIPGLKTYSAKLLYFLMPMITLNGLSFYFGYSTETFKDPFF